MSNLIKHAERELKILQGPGEVSLDGMDALMNKNILSIVKTFAKQGHSGFSAMYVVGILEKVLRYEPITPLTGEDSEWEMVTELGGYGVNKETYQNNRYNRVFKEGIDGRAYDIAAVVFHRGKDDSGFTNRKSHRFITFPYTPKTEHVIIPKWQFWR